MVEAHPEGLEASVAGVLEPPDPQVENRSDRNGKSAWEYFPEVSLP